MLKLTLNSTWSRYPISKVKKVCLLNSFLMRQMFCDAYNKKYPLVPFTVDTTTCYVLYGFILLIYSIVGSLFTMMTLLRMCARIWERLCFSWVSFYQLDHLQELLHSVPRLSKKITPVWCVARTTDATSGTSRKRTMILLATTTRLLLSSMMLQKVGRVVRSSPYLWNSKQTRV